MKIAMTTHGTRGDIQPFVSLARALMQRGHDVVLGTPVNLISFVERCGVRASPLAVDSQAFMESPEGRQWLSSGNAQKFMKELGAVIHAHRDELIADTLRLSEGADVLVTGLLTEDFASTVAEARNLPLLAVHFNGMRMNSWYANWLVSSRKLPPILNRATHALAEAAWWSGNKADVNHFRQHLGLAHTKLSTNKRMRKMGACTIHAFSPSIAPPPPEYVEAMPVVGAMHFPEYIRSGLGESTPEQGLVDWLASGTSPIFFGMGSMPVENPEVMLQQIVDVSHKLGKRALIGAGWSRLDGAKNLPGHVRIVGAVDHGWLLPQCCAAVHHGGAGTVQAVLTAGLPAVVASVFADQPFWGEQLHRQGVGVHLPFKRLNAKTLEEALRMILKPEFKSAAQKLGKSVRAEPDATPLIADRIEALLNA